MNRSELLHEIFENGAVMQRLMHGRFFSEFKQFDMPPSQIHLLVLLSQQDGIQPKELANKMCLTPGAITQLVEAVDGAGCIIRIPDKTDRRVVNIKLSAKGKSKVAAFKKAREQIFSNIISTLDDEELHTFVQIQKKMLAYFETQTQAKRKANEENT